MKVKAHLPDRDTDFFEIVVRVLQWDTLALNQFIIYQEYVHRTSIDLKKKKKIASTINIKKLTIHAETMTDEDYAVI